MSYVLEAFIGRRSAFEPLRHQYPSICVVQLTQGAVLIPLTAALLAEVDQRGGLRGDDLQEGFYKLSPAAADWGRSMSWNSRIAYVEAECHGGSCEQACFVWERGVVVLGPTTTDEDVTLLDGAINQALRALGVQAEDALDEFEALGLGRHRWTHDWLSECGKQGDEGR